MSQAKTTYLLILITWYILFFIFFIFLYIKYKKPYHLKCYVPIYKEIPEKLSPIELSMLLYHKITPNALTATIAYLIEEGIIIREGNVLKKGIKEIALSTSQESVLDLLFNVMGDGKKVDVVSISGFCNDNSNATSFLITYDVWKQLAVKEASTKQFFIQKMDYELVKWFQWIGYILAILNFVFKFNLIAGYIIIIPAYFLLKYFYKIYKRTRFYNEQFYLWLALGNYLGNVKEKSEITFNKKWAIIYSVLLNKSYNVEKVLNGEDFYTELNNSLHNCYNKAIFFGSRKI